MGFSSMDSFINNVTVSANFWRTDWNKNQISATAGAAGTWECMYQCAGNPPQALNIGNIVGPSLAWQTLTDTSVSAAPLLNGGDIASATETKHIVNASVFSAAATTAPCVWMLVDLLAFCPVTTITVTGDQALVTAALPDMQTEQESKRL